MNRGLSKATAIAIAIALLQVTCGAQPLAGTKPLDVRGDLASQMVDGIDRFLLRELEQSVAKRAAHWQRDVLSPQKYEAWLAAKRARLATMLGVVDERVKDTSPLFIAGPARPSFVGRGEGYELHLARWEALPGVWGEGLLFQPTGGQWVADVVAVPDADQTPEMLAGLAEGKTTGPQFAWQLALSGCRVLVPTLVDRSSEHSSIADGARRTNLPHREFVYRPAFEVGRHVIGYEVQKILAAVDWFESDAKRGNRKTAVIGYGEGGLLALYAGAIDTRIDVVGVSGAFGPREGLWREPIYRNVQGLLREFGDAELASMVAPRSLVLDAAPWPKVEGPPPANNGASGAAPGRLETPTQEAF